MKLIAYLREKYKEKYSVKQLKRLIDGKGCKVNGKVELISTRPLGFADKVVIDPSVLEKEELSCETLYEDEHFVICNKAVGVVCEPKSFKNLFLVHRLDKETSGVLILAKKEAIKIEMIALFRKKAVKKTYLAVVNGIPKEAMGKISSPIENNSAFTFWKLMKKGKKAALLLCEPITGRTHQIRIHLAKIGYPIIGDLVYGKSHVAHRHLLHAYSISFTFRGKEIKVIAKPPKDFLLALKNLGLS